MADPFWKRLPEVSWSRVAKWAGYPVFFFFCFVLFAYWTFPYERLRDRLVEEAGERGYELEIIDLSPSRLTGVTLEGVRVVLPGEAGEPPVDLLVDELTVRASLFSALSSTKSFSFDVEMAGGDAQGDIAVGEKDLEVDAEFADIELRQLPALRRFTKVPLVGTLNGEIVLDMPSEVTESTGNVDLTVTGLSAGDGETKVTVPGWGGLTLDEADLGTLEVQVAIADGVADIERFKADGKDIKLDIVGGVKLARPMSRSLINIMLKTKIEDAYKQKSPKVATMIDLASSGRDYQAALTADGSLQYKIAGSLAGRIRPVGAGKEPFRAPGATTR
ncbi:MAG: type II secretion system protein GspN [Polyangiales bacterium]